MASSQTAGGFPLGSPTRRHSLDQEYPNAMTNGSTATSVLPQTSGPSVADFEAASLAANRKLLGYGGRDLNTSFSRSLPGSLKDSVGDALLGTSTGGVSPKQRKSGLERREERGGVSGGFDGRKDLENGFVLRSDSAATTGASPAGSNVNCLPD